MIIDDEQTTKLLTENEDAIRTIARKLYIVGGTEDDLVQEGRIGFAQAIANYDESRGDTSSKAFKLFALMCAKRQMLDAIRRAGRKKNEPLTKSVPLDTSLPTKDQFVMGPEEVLLQKEEREQKIVRIDFTKTEKQIVEMLILGLSPQEIANNLNKSLKAINDSLYRIRKKLKGDE